MSDRTQFAYAANKKILIPRLLKRAIEVASASVLTVLIALLVMVINGFLAGRGGAASGFAVWSNFIGRSDIVATIVLTACVTAVLIAWQSRREGR